MIIYRFTYTLLFPGTKMHHDRISFFKRFFLVWMMMFILCMPCGPVFAIEKAKEPLPGQQKSTEALLDDIFSLLHSSPPDARKLAQTILDTLDENKTETHTELLKHIGSSYSFEENFVQALDYYSRALAKAKKENNYKQLADLHNNIGIVNNQIGNYKNALSYFTEALNYYSYLGDEQKKAITHNNIGLLYGDLKNYDKAMSQFRRALQSFSHKKDTLGTIASLSNIAHIHTVNNEFDSALYYTNRSITLSESANNQFGLCISYQGKGNIYLSIQQIPHAIAYFEKSRDIALKINHQSYYASSLLGISKSLLESEKKSEALQLTRKAMQTATDLSSLTLQSSTHMVFSNIYEAMGDFENSFYHYREHIKIKEELLNQTILHQIYDFEISSLSQTNQLQQLELERKELAISKKNNLLWFAVLVFILAITGLYFIYLNHRNHQRVKLQQTIIELTEKKSHAAVEAEIQERKRIGQELHDGLGQLLSVAGLNVSVLQKKKDIAEPRRTELLNAVMRSVDEAFAEVRNISHNLAPSLLSERGLKGALKNLTDQVNQSHQLQMSFETFGLEGKLNSLVENTLFRAIQEILNNTIKHSNASQLSLQIAQGNNEITLMAEDNGIGFDMTNLNGHSGHGLTHMKTRIENLNGSIHIDSNPARGTIISIVIPLNPTQNVRRTHQSIDS